VRVGSRPPKVTFIPFGILFATRRHVSHCSVCIPLHANLRVCFACQLIGARNEFTSMCICCCLSVAFIIHLTYQTESKKEDFRSNQSRWTSRVRLSQDGEIPTDLRMPVYSSFGGQKAGSQSAAYTIRALHVNRSRTFDSPGP